MAHPGIKNPGLILLTSGTCGYMSKYLKMYFKGPTFFVTNNINLKVDKIDPLLISIQAQ